MFDFTYTHRVNGKEAFSLECEISAEVEVPLWGREPIIRIDRILINGVDLGADEKSKPLGDMIEAAALADDDFRQSVSACWTDE